MLSKIYSICLLALATLGTSCGKTMFAGRTGASGTASSGDVKDRPQDAESSIVPVPVSGTNLITMACVAIPNTKIAGCNLYNRGQKFTGTVTSATFSFEK